MKHKVIILALLLVSSTLTVGLIFYSGAKATNFIKTSSGVTSIYQGDLIISGNTNYTIIDQQFDINGSIIVEGNATLYLKNSTLNFWHSSTYTNLTLQNPSNGKPRLQATNTTITWLGKFWITFRLCGNSSLTASRLNTMNITINAYDNSTVTLSDSNILGSLGAGFGLQAYDSSFVTVINSNVWDLGSYYSGSISVSNSTVGYMCFTVRSINCSIVDLKPGVISMWDYQSNCSVVIAPDGAASNVTIKNTQIQEFFFWLESSNMTIINSTISLISSGSSTIFAWGSIMNNTLIYDSTILWLINSTWYPIAPPQGFSRVYFCWYLDVHVVDKESSDVYYANVTVTYPNGTLVKKKAVDVNGSASFTLLEKMINRTNTYPIGNYTVTATYENYSREQTVNMTGNKQITITLPFIIPEFPSASILPLLMILTLVAVILRKTFRTERGKE